FQAVATALVDRVILGGAASLDEMVAVNASKTANLSQKQDAFRAAWERIEGRLKSPDEQIRHGYNFQGACAGAKLLTRAGHAPLEMTEMMFDPPGTWTQTYSLLATQRSSEQASS